MMSKFFIPGVYLLLLIINLVEPRRTDLSPLTGNVFRADGVALQPGDAMHTSISRDRCSCQWKCFALEACMSWSVSPVGTEDPTLWECRLSDVGPLDVTLDTNTQGRYYYFKDTVGVPYQVRADNLLYLVPDFKRGWNAANAWCKKLPGHRLAIFKTKIQGRILLNIQEKLKVGRLTFDLQRESNGDFNGGEPTSISYLNNEEGLKSYDSGDPASDIFYLALNSDYTELYLWDGQKDYPYWFICQANPLDVDW